MPFHSEEAEEDLFGAVSAMADRMGLKGEKRATYIDDHMLQGGYQRVQSRESYAPVQQSEEGESDGNRWGFGRKGPGKTRGNEDDSY